MNVNFPVQLKVFVFFFGTYLNTLPEKTDGIEPLKRGRGETIHSYHIYILKYDKSKFNNLSKSEFTKLLAAEGVQCFMAYPQSLYRQPLFQNKNFMCYAIPESVSYKEVSCKVTEKACYEEAIWIMQNAMPGSKDDIELIAEAIRKIRNAVN